MATGESDLPFIKNLASSDLKLRTSALSSLKLYLSSRRPPSAALTDLEARKLWKGLYYALWMCDRPIPQQNLALELANLLPSLHTSCAITWLRAFWAVMSAQWTEIDVLRMNKFLLLVRRVVAASFRWVQEMKFEAAAVEDMLAVFKDWPFDPEDVRRVPVGLRLHVLDIWVDELVRVGMLVEGGKGSDAWAETFISGMRGLVEPLVKGSTIKSVRERAKESLADDRLPGKKSEVADVEMEDDVADDGSWNGIED